MQENNGFITGRCLCGLWRGLGVVLAGLALACSAVAQQRGGPLHRASPDWRDQIVYFVVTDRFADGDPRNNDQNAGEYRPGDGSRYNGGDLRGLRQRLGYIQGLGATALWLTPPVANQWLDPAGVSAGYHGYWAENFMAVDRHLGTLDDYRALSRALHGRGMALVQDIVVNHTGNFFTYRHRWQPGDPAAGWEAHDLTRPVPRPSQSPFDRNDPRDAAQREQAIYHWTPDVADYGDPNQELNFQMSGLDDLNTENPQVRRALRRSYGHWIRQAGVDAFRVDTAFYVPPGYFDDFLRAEDPQAPGIDRVARATGRRQFLVFGEGFGIDRAGEDRQARKIESYMTAPDGRARLPGMLNFPLYAALGDVFARGRPPAELGARIEQTMRLHARPHTMPSFIDNHDVDRFLAGGSVAGLRQALLAMMTLPGIPVIYYGTEQGFTEPRAAMFAAGHASGGRDRYDTAAPLYRDIAAMSALRKGHRVFSRGLPQVLRADQAQPGALAWKMVHGATQALVVFNTAEHELLLDRLPTTLAPGTALAGLYGLHGRPASQRVDADGSLTLRLPPHSGQVWRVQGPVRAAPGAAATRAAPPAAARGAAPQVLMDPLPATRWTGDFSVSGQVRGAASVRVVVDGDLSRAPTAMADADGRWQARVDTAAMGDAQAVHRVTAWAGSGPAAPAQAFTVSRDWQGRADLSDPAGDDSGPDGRYTYPTDPGWTGRHLMDLRRVRVATAGGALRLELQMAALSQGWNPPNGFDRVAFTVYIELPGQTGGAQVMPLQNAQLPAGMRWHRRLRVHGWSNALFSDDGASATHEGRVTTPGAVVQADAASATVTLTLPAAALGRLADLTGARILVTTWDYDGGYRPLGAQAQPYAMGGGAPDEPRVMDASELIELR